MPLINAAGLATQVVQAAALIATTNRVGAQELAEYQGTQMVGLDGPRMWELGKILTIIVVTIWASWSIFNCCNQKAKRESVSFYMAPTGKKLHCTPECRTLKRTGASNIKRIEVCLACCDVEACGLHRQGPDSVKWE